MRKSAQLQHLSRFAAQSAEKALVIKKISVIEKQAETLSWKFLELLCEKLGVSHFIFLNISNIYVIILSVKKY